METGIAFAALDYGTGERFERLRQQLGVSTFGLNQIVLQPGQRGRIHRHARQEEVYLVLDGTLTLLGWALFDPSRAIPSAIAVLIAACPCALLLASPAAVAAAQ